MNVDEETRRLVPTARSLELVKASPQCMRSGTPDWELVLLFLSELLEFSFLLNTNLTNSLYWKAAAVNPPFLHSYSCIPVSLMQGKGVNSG